jgi:hypothetical protein
MKNFPGILFLVLTIVFFDSCAQKKALSFHVDFVQPYCGGARPTPQMEADAQKARPFSGKTIIIVSDKGKVDSVRTDAKGNFKKKLDAGTYKFYESWKYYKATPNGDPVSNFDKDCLEKEWAKAFREVTKGKSTVTEKSEGPIVIPCPWKVPCLLEQFMPPVRE